MISPQAQKGMEDEIAAAKDAAKGNPELLKQIAEAEAVAKASADRMHAAQMAGSGYIGALYGEFLKRGLIK